MSFKIVRRLGYIEARMQSMHSILNGTTQCTFCIELKGDIDIVKFKIAINSLKEEFDALNYSIESIENDYYFILSENNKIPLQEKKLNSEFDWTNALIEENNLILDEKFMLWRVLVGIPAEKNPNRNTYIYFTWHHAMADAFSIDIVLSRLFNLYVNNSYSLKESELNNKNSLEHSLPSNFIENWKDFLDRSLEAPNRKRVMYGSKYKLLDRETYSQAYSLSDKVLSKLKLSGNSINTCIAASLLKSYREILSTGTGISMQTAFSLRKIAGLGSQDVGCHISVLELEFDDIELSYGLSELATVYKSKIAKSVINIQKHPAAYQTEVIKNSAFDASKYDHCTFDIIFTSACSNIKKENKNLDFGSIYPTANRNMGNAVIYIHALEFEDSIDLTFNITKSVISDELLMDFIKIFEVNILMNINSSYQPNL